MIFLILQIAIALILKMDINATPMVKRVARRAFISFNLEHVLHFLVYNFFFVTWGSIITHN